MTDCNSTLTDKHIETLVQTRDVFCMYSSLLISAYTHKNIYNNNNNINTIHNELYN